MNTHIHQHGKLLIGKIVISYDCLCQLGVGNQYHIIGKHPDFCRTPVYIRDIPLLPRLKLNIIVNANLLAGNYVKPRENVSQRFLQAKRYGKTANTQSCKKRRYGKSEAAQNYQSANNENNNIEGISRKRGKLVRSITSFGV